VSDHCEEFAKDSRNVFVYNKISRGGMDYVVLGWYVISWCQHRDERTAK
jgi:hypothetical protein